MYVSVYFIIASFDSLYFPLLPWVRIRPKGISASLQQALLTLVHRCVKHVYSTSIRGTVTPIRADSIFSVQLLLTEERRKYAQDPGAITHLRMSHVEYVSWWETMAGCRRD